VNFSMSHTLPESDIMVRWCIFHNPAFALLETIAAVTDRQMGRHVAVAKTTICIAWHSMARVKMTSIQCKS